MMLYCQSGKTDLARLLYSTLGMGVATLIIESNIMRTENEIGNKLFGPPLKRQGCGRIFQGPHNAVFGRKAFSMKTWCVQRFLCLTTLTLTLSLPTTLRP